jgi:hypothetical protein
MQRGLQLGCTFTALQNYQAALLAATRVLSSPPGDYLVFTLSAKGR